MHIISDNYSEVFTIAELGIHQQRYIDVLALLLLVIT